MLINKTAKNYTMLSPHAIQARGDSGSGFIDESDNVTFVTTCTACGEVVHAVKINVLSFKFYLAMV